MYKNKNNIEDFMGLRDVRVTLAALLTRIHAFYWLTGQVSWICDKGAVTFFVCAEIWFFSPL